MSEKVPTPNASLPLSVTWRVDEICDGFETAWKTAASTGRRPRIEDFLSNVPEPDRLTLLRELLALDLSYRRQNSERPVPEVYQKRFPSHSALIAAVFNDENRSKAQDPAVTAEPVPRAMAETVDMVRSVDRRAIPAHELPTLLGQGGEQTLKTLGQYVILDRLGEGGMGEVFKARHRLMDRVVALKVIRKECLDNPAAISRFYQEIRAAAQLNHPNVVIAHDADHVDDTHYFVMEYIEGIDLAKLVKKRGPLPVGKACDYVRQAALGLQHAHERGLVHRDIKPSNLLVTMQNQVKILDMGLARINPLNNTAEARTALTQEGAVMGTPDFMSPEQSTNSRQVDIRSDLYSLGCTLFYLLTGRAPFAGGTVTDKLLKHQREEPPPLEKMRADVPPDVAAIVRKLLAKKPEDRFPTPAALANALRPFVRQTITTTAPKNVPSSKKTQDDISTDLLLAQNQGDGLATVAYVSARDLGQKRTRRWVLVVAGLLACSAAAGVVAMSTDAFRGDVKRPVPDDVVQPVEKDKVQVQQVQPAALAMPRDTPEIRKKKSDSRDIIRQLEPLAVALAWPPENLSQAPLLWNGKRLVIPESTKPPPPPVSAPPGLITRIKHTAAVKSVAISPDGQRVLFSGADNALRMWNVLPNRVSPFFGLEDVVWSAVFSEDGHYALTGSGGYYEDGKLKKGKDNTLRLWDGVTGSWKRTFRLHAGQAKKVISHDDSVRGVGFASDGNTAVSGSYDRTVRVWNVEKGELLRTMKTTNRVLSVAISRDGKHVVAGCLDSSVLLWDLDSKRDDAPPRTLKGHSDMVTGVAFSADGERIVSASGDKTVRVWNTKSGKEVYSYQGHTGAVLCVAVASLNNWVLSAGSDQDVRLWNLQDGKEIHCFQGHEQAVNSVGLSQDGQRAVSGGDDRTVRVWRLPPKPLGLAR